MMRSETGLVRISLMTDGRLWIPSWDLNNIGHGNERYLKQVGQFRIGPKNMVGATVP